MKTLQKSIEMTVNETSSNQDGTQNKISILNAYSVNFVQRDNTIFSAYYVKRAFVGHDLICEIRHGNSTYHVKVNDDSILDRVVKNYLPGMLSVKGVDNDFLIIALSEGVLRGYKIKSTVSLKIYKVRYSPNITLFDMGKIPLSNSVNSLKEEVKYPVVLYQSRVDTVVIIGRVDNDDRAKLPDRFYVMWRMQYHDGKFQLIKPMTRGIKFNSKYLFKYSGYIGYGKYSDKLIMVSDFKRHLNLLYVGKYLSAGQKFFSSLYEISVDYNLNLNIAECLINHRYGCNLADSARYDIPMSGIDVISAVRNGEDTYVAYVGVVPDGKFKNDDQLVVVHSKAGNQLSIYDFMQIKEHIASLYVKHVENSIIITIVGLDNIIKYGIPELQLRSGNITHIDVIQFSRHEVTNIADFVHVVTQDVLLADAYAKVRTVEAKKTDNNYMAHMSFSIREVQSKDIFTTMQSHISTDSINMPVYEVTTPTSYMTTYDLLKESEGLQEVTSNLNSTARVNVEHMTTGSLPYVSSDSKKEIKKSTLYYGSHVIPSTTQSVILTTDSSTKSSVGNNTADFVGKVLVSTNHNHSTAKVNVEHMTTGSLPYVSSDSKKEIKKSTLYYGSHVIPSTTQSVILTTDSSTKSSVGNNTADFVGKVLVLTNHNHSTAKVNVEHMTTGSLPYVSSDSKKEIKKSTLYYGSHVIPSTTQSVILTTDSSTKSSVGDNTADFVGKVLVSTNHNHHVSSVTRIPAQSTTVKRAKFTTGKKYIGKASDVEYGVLNKKTNHKIRSTTRSSLRSKSTLRRHVFYDEDLETTNDYAVTGRLNFTTTSISRSESFFLTNDSISRNKTYPVNYNSSNHGLLVGGIFIVGLIIMLFVGVFYNKFGCNRLRRNLTRCMDRSSRGCNIPELQVFELSDMQEIVGIQIPNRIAY
ncbi:hypothetical protein [Ehrlichia muris]|uniref:Uncharacterized protein n=1 Tax=Ehrlichia muris AS145 TaxID=1423892 RepID=V9R805_9RICK|nr:hypothetical protein [Ehrlichia muris]AHC38974.1 hypothetical protein EMUR_00670 [Ehrlichia muris AS145]